MVIEALSDKAQTDLQDAISCVYAAASSDRADFLLECAERYMACCLGKMKLAIMSSRLTQE
jgi:hypothetical protein